MHTHILKLVYEWNEFLSVPASLVAIFSDIKYKIQIYLKYKMEL